MPSRTSTSRCSSSLGVDKVPHGDRDLGQLALIEGDATVSMTYWAQKNLSTMGCLQLLGSSLDPGQLQALNAMPAFLRETALFPYRGGPAVCDAASRCRAAGTP